MKKFSLFSKNGAIAQSYVNHAARIIDQTFAEKSRQTILGETKLICWSSGKNIYKGRSAKWKYCYLIIWLFDFLKNNFLLFK